MLHKLGLELPYFRTTRPLPSPGRHLLKSNIFRVEQFRTYVYSRLFTIESDHKLLESITQKSLSDTPAWLQCMPLCMKGYDCILHFHPGKEMVLPDTLPCFNPKLALILHWILPSTMLACPLSQRKPSNWVWRWMLRCVPWLTSSSLAGLITSRKSHIHCIPTGNTVNHPLLKMDSCSMENPSSSLHQKGRQSLVHCTSHQGITKMQLFNQGSVIWPGINKTIEEAVQQCETCMSFQALNAVAPLTSTPTPTHP